MHRKLFIILCSLVLCIPLLAVSVSAENFNFETFIDSATFDGSSYTFHYILPASSNGKFILVSGDKPQITFDGTSFSFIAGMFNLSVDDFLTMFYYPYGESNYFTIGDDSTYGTRLRSGSLKWDQTNSTSGLSVVIGSEKVRIFFYDKFYNQLSTWEGDPDVDTISVPAKAAYFNIQYYTKFLITQQKVSCVMDTISLTNIVSDTTIMQEGIIGPAGEYIPPSNGSSVGDLDQVEDGLLGGLDSVKDSIVDLASTAISKLSSLVSTFGFISELIRRFFLVNSWSMPLFYVSLSVGIFALLVNVSASFVGGKIHD